MKFLVIVAGQTQINPGYCVGVSEETVCDEGYSDGCDSWYGFGVAYTDQSDPVYSFPDFNPTTASDLCGQSVNGSAVNCIGDISQQCVSYGVATYGYLNCRTYCPSAGDGPCWLDNGGATDRAIDTVLVCDIVAEAKKRYEPRGGVRIGAHL
jgi:hypothetical protein